MENKTSSFWLKLPSGLAHELAPIGVKLYADFASCQSESLFNWQPLEWRGLQFRNRLGIAGGVDKNGDCLPEWPKLGCGFVEIGTITPRPQKANPGKIMDRDISRKNLWNRMGFPSDGAAYVAANLAKHPIDIPVFINIGKNRDTSNSDAAADYIEAMDRLSPYADAFVVNISSPNTSGLRELQQANVLNQLCRKIVNRAKNTPVLLKLSPDMTDAQFIDAVDVAANSNIGGLILSNTTLARPEGSKFPKEGGLSGQDLADRAKELLHKAQAHLGRRRGEMLIVSTGGILTPADVQERLAMGADLVQVYSALVFSGPRFFSQVAKHMHKKNDHQ